MQLHLQNVPGDNVADICKAAGVKRWLESSGTLCEVTYLGTSQYLALAHKRGVAVVQLGTRESGGVLREKARVPFRRFNTLSCEGDVTAMHWIRVGQGSAKTPLLLVGTKNGALIVLSHRTALLHRQELSAHAISCIQDRRRQDKAEEVLLLSSPNTLVTLSTTPLCGLADARYLEPVSDDDKARRPTDSDPFSEDVLDYAISASTYSIHAPLSGGLPCVFHKLASQGGEVCYAGCSLRWGTCCIICYEMRLSSPTAVLYIFEEYTQGVAGLERRSHWVVKFSVKAISADSEGVFDIHNIISIISPFSR